MNSGKRELPDRVPKQELGNQQAGSVAEWRQRDTRCHRPSPRGTVDARRLSQMVSFTLTPSSQLLGRRLSVQQALDPFHIGMHDSRFPQIAAGSRRGTVISVHHEQFHKNKSGTRLSADEPLRESQGDLSRKQDRVHHPAPWQPCGLLAGAVRLDRSPGVRRFDLLGQAVERAAPHKILFGSDGPWLHPGVEMQDPRAEITAGRRAAGAGRKPFQIDCPSQSTGTTPSSRSFTHGSVSPIEKRNARCRAPRSMG